MKSDILWHRAWGNPENEALVFLHGFMGTHLDFLPIIHKLSEDFYCIALDLPFHGHSKKFQPTSLQAFQKLLLNTLHSIPKKTYSIVGYSLGGRLALSLLEELSLDSLILLSTRIFPLSSQEEKEIEVRNQRITEKLTQEPYTLFLDWWYSMDLFKTLKEKPLIYQKMIKEREKENAAALSKAFALLSPTKELKPKSFLSKLKKPLLYVSGLKDSKYTSFMNLIHRDKKDAWLFSLSNASHALHLEAPLEISQIIKQFHRYYYDSMDRRKKI